MVDRSELEKIREDIRRCSGIPDGPVCLDRYLTAPRRIVWVLREVNSSDRDWELPDLLCNHLFESSRWYCTYGLVAKVSRALLQCPVPEQLPSTSASEAAGFLRDVAVINVKKTGGGRRINQPSLAQGARAFRQIVVRQLEALDAHILIAAGTSRFLPDLNLRARIVRTYHPGQSRLTHAAFYESLVGVLGAVVR